MSSFPSEGYQCEFLLLAFARSSNESSEKTNLLSKRKVICTLKHNNDVVFKTPATTESNASGWRERTNLVLSSEADLLIFEVRDDSNSTLLGCATRSAKELHQSIIRPTTLGTEDEDTDSSLLYSEVISLLPEITSTLSSSPATSTQPALYGTLTVHYYLKAISVTSPNGVDDEYTRRLKKEGLTYYNSKSLKQTVRYEDLPPVLDLNAFLQSPIDLSSISQDTTTRGSEADHVADPAMIVVTAPSGEQHVPVLSTPPPSKGSDGAVKTKKKQKSATLERKKTKPKASDDEAEVSTPFSALSLSSGHYLQLLSSSSSSSVTASPVSSPRLRPRSPSSSIASDTEELATKPRGRRSSSPTNGDHLQAHVTQQTPVSRTSSMESTLSSIGSDGESAETSGLLETKSTTMKKKKKTGTAKKKALNKELMMSLSAEEDVTTAPAESSGASSATSSRSNSPLAGAEGTLKKKKKKTKATSLSESNIDALGSATAPSSTTKRKSQASTAPPDPAPLVHATESSATSL